MKRDPRKGFTLVEVIVTLVILAVLAALLVPALTGWIDRARNAALIEDCRRCVQAVQGLATEHYADGAAVDLAEAKQLAEVEGDISAVSMRGSPATSVAHLTYTLGGESVTYCAAPDTCADHSESYTLGGAVGGGTTSTRFSSAGNSIQAAYETLPARLKYSRIDSAALQTPGSAAAELYNALSPEQQQTMDDYVWCTSQQPEGFRIYFAKAGEAVAGTTFPLYKYNPTTGKYQISQGGRIDASGKIILPSGWGEWVDSID